MNRYHAPGSEGQFEKDSGEQVLANKLGIASSDEIDEAELVLLEKLYHFVFEEHFPHEQLSLSLLKSWHRRWLGNIYQGQDMKGRIHPFREGNGSVSRLLANVMAVQSGFRHLDYQRWEQNKT